MAEVGLSELEVDDRQIALRTMGAGPPLVLLNGYGATSSDWDPSFLETLAESFQLLCPDNRGMGGSALGDPAALSVDAMASDVEAILDARGLERAAVAGWSMGGFVAQRLAMRAPQRIQGLILLSTDPGGANALRADPEIWLTLTDHSGSPREQATRLIALLFPAEIAIVIDQLFGDQVAEARASLSLEALEAQEAAMAAWHRGDQPTPSGLELQVLVACGAADAVIPAGNSELLADRWPNARLEQFVDGGHAFMAQHPTELANLITDFLGGP
jgi:pimeloyl-ACP methyl ester carboxylesterase